MINQHFIILNIILEVILIYISYFSIDVISYSSLEKLITDIDYKKDEKRN
jgi:hypothetical protein